MRLMQQKREAYWFYRYLSVFYDKLVNPLFWTRPMREAALNLEKWSSGMRVIDVGSGTGFTTQGIVQRVPADQVTCVDQSPHQMQHAKQKPELQGCHFLIGDAEQIPVESDSFDRYVSAGSIEYWPDPQRGVNEAYRVLKPGGRALLIGPLEPRQAFSRYMANTWMLFPKEEEYFQLFETAGFDDIRYKFVRPHWIRSDRYGIAISGRKPTAGASPADVPRMEVVPGQEVSPSLSESITMFGRVLIGSLAGFVFIPMALLGYARAAIDPVQPSAADDPHEPEVLPAEPLNVHQKGVLIGLAAIAGLLIWRSTRRSSND